MGEKFNESRDARELPRGGGAFRPGSGGKPAEPSARSVNSAGSEPRFVPRRPVGEVGHEASTIPRENDFVAPDEALRRIVELETLLEKLQEAQERRPDWGDEVDELGRRLDQLSQQAEQLKGMAASGYPVERPLLEHLYDAVVRVTVIAVLGGVIGGPTLMVATHGVLAEKIIEGVAAGLTAGVSTEAAEAALRFMRSRDIEYRGSQPRPSAKASSVPPDIAESYTSSSGRSTADVQSVPPEVVQQYHSSASTPSQKKDREHGLYEVDDDD